MDKLARVWTSIITEQVNLNSLYFDRLSSLELIK